MFDLNLLQVAFWRWEMYFVAFGCGCRGHSSPEGCWVRAACSPEHEAVAYDARQQGCEPASKTA